MNKYNNKIINTKDNKLPRHSQGFTLVETLIAISIFISSILIMLVVLGSGISSNSYTKQKIIATYLAEEGIEYIHNIRDTYALYSLYNTPSTIGWEDFIDKIVPCDATTNNAKSCYFDYKKNELGASYDIFNTTLAQPLTHIYIATCPNNGCPHLLKQIAGSTKGEYNYENVSGNSVDSGFTRTIRTKYISANEVEIISTVYWGQGLNTKRITFTDYLFNWIE